MTVTGAARQPQPMTPRDYHERSKHALGRYAPGPASLDWDAQPDPYRTYQGCERVLLPTGDTQPQADQGTSLVATPKPPPRPIPLDTCRSPLAISSRIAALLRLGLGISAWKEMGDVRWAVRCNPSSGNLHPVEAYVAVPPLEGLPAGLHHYESLDHALERRCLYDADTAALLARLAPPGTLLLGLSLIPWREAWKYGYRAWRYCQLDLGHAIAALDYAAACVGWRLTPLPGWSADDLGRLLGLDRRGEFEPDEPELPQAIFLVSPSDGPVPSEAGPAPLAARAALLGRLPSQVWEGRANRLDPRHLYRWPAVEAMGLGSGPIEPESWLGEPIAGSRGGQGARDVFYGRLADLCPASGLPSDSEAESAARIILRRRSARVFDPRLAISADALYRLLDACLPRPGAPPWDALGWPARLHLLLFVHRVEGLDPGLYLFARDRSEVPGLKVRLRPEFDWTRPAGCPERLALHTLVRANARGTAGRLACHQQIAADSSLALAMLAELPADSPQTRYDGLLREAGALGQVLYLESESLGLGASGIGCFFDEPIHEILGVPGGDLQTFYMFTLGPAIPDPLASDAPAYPHRA